MLLCEDFENLMFKPIRSIVETIVKLAPLCIALGSLLLISILGILYDHPTFLVLLSSKKVKISICSVTFDSLHKRGKP